VIAEQERLKLLEDAVDDVRLAIERRRRALRRVPPYADRVGNESATWIEGAWTESTKYAVSTTAVSSPFERAIADELDRVGCVNSVSPTN
jgi:hypothetical protein